MGRVEHATLTLEPPRGPHLRNAIYVRDGAIEPTPWRSGELYIRAQVARGYVDARFTADGSVRILRVRAGGADVQNGRPGRYIRDGRLESGEDDRQVKVAAFAANYRDAWRCRPSGRRGLGSSAREEDEGENRGRLLHELRGRQN